MPNADDWHWYDKQKAQMSRRMLAVPGGAIEWEGVTFEDVGGEDTPLSESNKSEFFASQVQYELRGKR